MFRKNTLQLNIYVSALALAASMFLPLTTLPVVGEVSYNRIAGTESWLVIVFALAGPGLLLAGRAKWAILSPVAVWLVFLYPAIRSLFESADDNVFGRLGDQVTSAMVDFSSDLFLNVADFDWGGLVLLLALLDFTLTGILYRLKA